MVAIAPPAFSFSAFQPFLRPSLPPNSRPILEPPSGGPVADNLESNYLSTGHPTLTLKDAEGGIVAVLVDETLNLRNLKTGQAGEVPVTGYESEFIIGLYEPTTRPGRYDLYLSVGRRDGTSEIALPLTDDDGQRRYKLGQIDLTAKDTP